MSLLSLLLITESVNLLVKVKQKIIYSYILIAQHCCYSQILIHSDNNNTLHFIFQYKNLDKNNPIKLIPVLLFPYILSRLISLGFILIKLEV